MMDIKIGTVENIEIKYSEMERDLSLKPYSLLNFLQDLASKNAEELGFGYSNMYPRNLAWFLIKYRMEFINYPKGLYNLTIKTEPRGYNKLFAYRDFEICDGGKIIGRIASTWAVIDTDKKCMVPIQKAFDNNVMMKPYLKQENDLVYTKIPQLNKIDSSETFNVRYSDIDVNGHANNGNYIIWALEPLDFSFRTTHKIKAMDLVFKKEAKYGEKIVSELEYLTDNTSIHLLKNSSGEDLFALKAEWENTGN